MMVSRVKNTLSPAWQALLLWGVFIMLNILLNGTIPFLLGKDMHAWTVSPIKSVLFNFIQYGIMFLLVPLVLTKGWATVRQPRFLLPLLLAIFTMTLRVYYRPAAAIAVLSMIWLHIRYDLSELGFRLQGWRADRITVLLVAILIGAQRFFNSEAFSLHLTSALSAGLDRLFLNPASTTEYIFYFGFLAERLSTQFGRRWTPFMIGLMYGFHEMTNPEYWYEGKFFPVIIFGVTILAMIYLWRRNVIALWLGDGLGRFLSNLF